MKTVNVQLAINSYPIHIGTKLFNDKALIQDDINHRKICIISNQVIADLYLEQVINWINAPVSVLIVNDGEPYKNQQTLNQIYDHLIEQQLSRDSLLIALGGGIVGDITGFAAATYQRGIDFLQIPTTLLAQVDSSVGGKTAINHPLGKNLIGAFYQPKTVYINTDVLSSLPQREFSAGLCEVIKYGLIRDETFFNYLEKNIKQILQRDPDVLEEIIYQSCLHKAQVVSLDEKEKGERATLNLGHTFGHAIEALTEYKTYLHGEAVAIGTIMAAELSQLQNTMSIENVARIKAIFTAINAPISLPAKFKISAQEIRESMQRDKKVQAGQLKLILLSEIGNAYIELDTDESKIIQSIKKVIL